MTLGEYVQDRREQLEMTRTDLSRKSGISFTEIKRIETGVRGCPSLKNLGALAKALDVPQDKLMKLAGYETSKETTSIKHLFPGLKTRKQQFAVERIADSLSRNSDLKDKDLDAIYRQTEMYLDYVTKKKEDPE